MLAVDEGWHLLMSLGEFDLVLSFFYPITIIAIIGLEIFVDFSMASLLHPSLGISDFRNDDKAN